MGRGAYRLPGSFVSLALWLRAAAKACAVLASGVGAVKAVVSSRSFSSAGFEAASAALEAKRRAHVGAVRRGNCPGRNALASRVPSRAPAIVECPLNLMMNAVVVVRCGLEISVRQEASDSATWSSTQMWRCGRH